MNGYEGLIGERLQKVLSAEGLGSRRQIEKLIVSGRICVNGNTAKLGDRLLKVDVLAIDGKEVTIRNMVSTKRVIIYNKPIGEICTRFDPEGRKTVFEKLPTLSKERWISVGRLDINTSGLLLFTNDGFVANRLMHPSFSIEREYAVRVSAKNVDNTKEAIENLLKGIALADGAASFSQVVKIGGGHGVNCWYYVCLTEGRNREVRRLWESQGYCVSRLKRVRYGTVSLPRNLKSGGLIELDKKEIQKLLN